MNEVQNLTIKLKNEKINYRKRRHDAALCPLLHVKRLDFPRNWIASLVTGLSVVYKSIRRIIIKLE